MTPTLSSLIHVLPPVPTGSGYDYLWPEPVPPKPGSWVEIPFGRQTRFGLVLGEGKGDVPAEKLRAVLRQFDLPPVPEAFLRFLQWAAAYTLTPPGLLLKMACPLPDALTPGERRRLKSALSLPNPEHFRLFPLSPEQQEAATALTSALHERRFQPFLLDGVTGSGKTEVYFQAVAEALKDGGQVLVLLPEIALTAQWLERFRTRFGLEPTVWHSDITPARRRENWRRIVAGEARLVVGARSALFLPFPNLRLLIVDEEHEAAYKQEEGVLYQARDMAVLRARQESLPVVLVSATPALESWHNAAQGKYQRLHLPSRHGTARLPDVTLIDMRQANLPSTRFISPLLEDALRQTLENRQQSLLFLNRRGFAPLTLCRGCGHRLACPHCTAWLVLHQPKRGRPYLQCHHCGFTRPELAECPECQADASKLAACGPGVERLAEEARSLFPDARIAVMTSDAIATAAAAQTLIEQMTAGQIDLLIGTQMVAKGHHFPNLTLVGIVDGDTASQGSDLRAAERSFQLLHQVAGRAGRESTPGQVLIQTYDPAQPVLRALRRHDRDGFYQLELRAREFARMPPFTRLAAIIISGRKEAEVQQAAQRLARDSARLTAHPGVQLLGPAPAALYRLRQNYRYRFLIKAPLTTRLQPLISDWLAHIPLSPSVTCRADIDPYSFV